MRGGGKFRGVKMRNTFSLDSLVVELSQRLPAAKLKEIAARFSYEDADLPEKLGKSYRAAGYLTLDQLGTLVDWKTAGRQTKNFRDGNTEITVQLVTACAAQAAEKLRDTPHIAASMLLALRAVHFPTASVILTAWDPNEYGILDVRAWSALRTLSGDGAFDRGKRTLFTAAEFRLYTLLLRRWGHRADVSPRIIDRALWQFDKEQARND